MIGLLLSVLLSALTADAAIVDQIVREGLSKWDVPGAAVVIVSADRIAYLNGHGLREISKPETITADTVFPLASCTKAFTATLLAQLVSEGKISWDDPVRKHLPSFHLSEPLADGDVVLRDLLTHRTGVGSHDYLWYRSPLSQSGLVDRLQFLPLQHRFRTAFQYQSIMYSAVGFAAAKADGGDWSTSIQKRLFDPLGMTGATCKTPTDLKSAAKPHRVDRDGKLQPISYYVQDLPNSAGSIHLCARDLAPWLQFQLTDGTFRGQRLVDAKAFAETHRPQITLRLEGLQQALHPDTLQMSYAMGWVVHDYRGELVRSHAGLIDGFRCQLTLLPRAGIGIGVMCNRHDSRMTQAVTNTLIDALLGLPPKDWNQYLLAVTKKDQDVTAALRRERDQARSLGPPPRPLQDFVGVYSHPAYGKMEISAKEEKLHWNWSSFNQPLSFHHDLMFEILDLSLGDPLLVFEVEQGQARAFKLFDVTFRR